MKPSTTLPNSEVLTSFSTRNPRLGLSKLGWAVRGVYEQYYIPNLCGIHRASGRTTSVLTLLLNTIESDAIHDLLIRGRPSSSAGVHHRAHEPRHIHVLSYLHLEISKRPLLYLLPGRSLPPYLAS